MNEYIEFAVRVPKDDADSFIARFGRKNVKILGYLLGEEIVRCRGCKHFPGNCDWCYDDDPDGFCSWGRKKGRMTNKEWLDYLAHNAPDELAAWFDAEHVETEERALDGDTAAQDGDSRDKLEADAHEIAEAYNMDTQRHGSERFAHELYHSIMHLLDRQRAITKREWAHVHDMYIDELRKERDDAESRSDKLTAERDKLKELNEYHALQYELASEDADRLQAQVDRLSAEREHYRSMCSEMATNIQDALSIADEGLA